LSEKLVPTRATSSSPTPEGTVGSSPAAASPQSGRVMIAVAMKETAMVATMASTIFSMTR
jgi:hypothetical protein